MIAHTKWGAAAVVAACAVVACGGSHTKEVASTAKPPAGEPPDAGPQAGPPDAGPPAAGPPPAASALLILEIPVGQGSVRVEGVLAGAAVASTCSAHCELKLDEGSNARLTAQAAEGFLLDAWEGACTGSDPCSIHVQGQMIASARFKQAPKPPKELKYDALDLSRLDGPNAVTDAAALDDAGAVAGRICDAPPMCPTMAWDVFLWNGSLHRFRIPEGDVPWVVATAGGRVAGELQDGSGTARAFVTEGNNLVELDSLGDSAHVRAMNSAGTVVGRARTPSLEWHAVAWKAGVLVDLGARTNSVQSEALAIDDAGRIAVLACDTSKCHALVFTGDDMVDLGAIPDQMWVRAMSTRGKVIGTLPAVTPSIGRWAITWSGGEVTSLNEAVNARAWPSLGFGLGSHLESALDAVAGIGDAVGEVDIAISEGAAMTAILWRDGKLFDLQAAVEPATRLHSAYAINARGQILAKRGPRFFHGQLLLTPR